MGFEPTAFPVLPGRAHQALDESPILLALDVSLPSYRLASCRVRLGIDQFPRAPILEGEGVIRVVIGDSFFEILSLTDVVSAAALALQDIEKKGHPS